VQLWDCWNDPGNQQWFIVPATYHPGYKIINMYAWRCLDADLGHINENGARVQLWDCWQDPGNAHWYWSQYPGSLP
jgi:hypothetical protein